MTIGVARPEAERAELIRRAREGDPWEAIGRDFGIAKQSAQTAFRRYGSEADQAARQQALAGRKFNCPPTYAERPAGPIERSDPWAGMGNVFA